MNTVSSKSIKRKNSVANSRKFPAKSQALVYEVHLKELYQKYPKRPCKERVVEVFRVFGKAEFLLIIYCKRSNELLSLILFFLM